jgi:Na+/H+ antiporter NhaC
MIGSLLGLLVAAAIAAWKGAVAPTAIGKAILDGTLHVAPALAILWLSWTLSHLSGEEHLATGNYLASLLDNRLPLWAYPTLIFLLGAAVSFATGTSWGTMGILFPIAIPLVVQALKTSQGSVDPYDPIMISSLGAVLAGSIFGDHCSPISDTTILSSRSSQCHHMEHVRTQMPYALLSAVVAVLCGTLPCALGVPASICLLAGLAVLFVFLHAFGGRAEDPVVADKPSTGT